MEAGGAGEDAETGGREREGTEAQAGAGAEEMKG